MQKLTIGLIVLTAALVLTAGAVAAHGMTGTANDDSETDEMSMDEQQEECEAMMDEIDDCPMADGGMMGMMHDDGMEECQEMMGDEMTDEMMDDSGMMGMMDGNESGMGCH